MSDVQPEAKPTKKTWVSPVTKRFASSRKIFLRRAEQSFEAKLDRMDDLMSFLEKRGSLKYLQVVEIKSRTVMSQLLGSSYPTEENREFGIIVGHMEHDCRRDGEYNHYRVWESKRNPFVGTDVDSIQPLDSWDGVPEIYRSFSEKVYLGTSPCLKVDVPTSLTGYTINDNPWRSGDEVEE